MMKKVFQDNTNALEELSNFSMDFASKGLSWGENICHKLDNAIQDNLIVQNPSTFIGALGDHLRKMYVGVTDDWLNPFSDCSDEDPKSMEALCEEKTVSNAELETSEFYEDHSHSGVPLNAGLDEAKSAVCGHVVSSPQANFPDVAENDKFSATLDLPQCTLSDKASNDFHTSSISSPIEPTKYDLSSTTRNDDSFCSSLGMPQNVANVEEEIDGFFMNSQNELSTSTEVVEDNTEEDVIQIYAANESNFDGPEKRSLPYDLSTITGNDGSFCSSVDMPQIVANVEEEMDGLFMNSQNELSTSTEVIKDNTEEDVIQISAANESNFDEPEKASLPYDLSTTTGNDDSFCSSVDMPQIVANIEEEMDGLFMNSQNELSTSTEVIEDNTEEDLIQISAANESNFDEPEKASLPYYYSEELHGNSADLDRNLNVDAMTDLNVEAVIINEFEDIELDDARLEHEWDDSLIDEILLIPEQKSKKKRVFHKKKLGRLAAIASKLFPQKRKDHNEVVTAWIHERSNGGESTTSTPEKLNKLKNSSRSDETCEFDWELV